MGFLVDAKYGINIGDMVFLEWDELKLPLSITEKEFYDAFDNEVQKH